MLAGAAFVLMIRTGTRAPFVVVVGSLGFLFWYSRTWMKRYLHVTTYALRTMSS